MAIIERQSDACPRFCRLPATATIRPVDRLERQGEQEGHRGGEDHRIEEVEVAAEPGRAPAAILHRGVAFCDNKGQ